jgi:CheY-like chemotaxis protein
VSDARSAAVGRERTVLCVDDSPVHLKILSRYLEQGLGCRTLRADGVEAAVRHLLHGPADLVVTDLMMPDLDGGDLIKIMRDRAAWKTIPVVVHSAASDLSRIRALSELGLRDYILKPFDPGIAVPRLKRCLAALPPTPPPPEERAAERPSDRVPVLLITSRAGLGERIQAAVGPLYDVIVVPSAISALAMTLEIRPWMVFVSPDLADWDVSKTRRSLLALQTEEKMRVIPVPSAERGEGGVVEAVRRELGDGPFAVRSEAETVTVTVREHFTASCLGALQQALKTALPPDADKVLFDVPRAAIEGSTLAALNGLASLVRSRER